MDNVFCSQECHREYQSIHQTGEEHHHYKPNSTDEYGPNWYRQRRKALERDNHQCQFCGLDKEDHHQSLSVHHIEPREEFVENGEFDYEQANQLDNLISLCQACHRKVEQWGLLPDKR
jgi:5-methylcytosine-specific restriction endonuclease McrA